MSFCSPGRTRPGRVFGPSLLAPLLLGVCTAAASLNAPQPAAAAPPTASIPAAAASALPTAPVTRLAAGLAPLPLLSEQGQQLLFRSRLRADYVPLSQEFLTQATLSYCGVASAVMVLNSLAIPAPAASGYGPYRFWTQENLFEGSRGGPEAAMVRQRGMTLAQLRQLLAGRGVIAVAIEASDLNLTTLRQLPRRILADPDYRLLANYDRRAIGQAGGGHISPLAAFDEGSDRVLILDVARYRYPSAWVPLSLLLQAMQRPDADSGRSRGLVRISRPSAASAPPAATPRSAS